MPDSHHRMLPDHPWASIAHDLFDALAHLGFVAVYCAVLAGWFFNAEGAFIKTFLCIGPELGTLHTE